MQPLSLSLAIGAGGFCGAVGRFWLSSAVAKQVGENHAYAGTMTVNLLGCLAIGILAVVAQHTTWLSPSAQKFAITGLLGALTTFSTFSLEAIQLMQDGRTTTAIIKVACSVILGLLFVWVGMKLGQTVIPPEALDRTTSG